MLMWIGKVKRFIRHYRIVETVQVVVILTCSVAFHGSLVDFFQTVDMEGKINNLSTASIVAQLGSDRENAPLTF